jgi:hypothetical protein
MSWASQSGLLTSTSSAATAVVRPMRSKGMRYLVAVLVPVRGLEAVGLMRGTVEKAVAATLELSGDRWRPLLATAVQPLA